MLDPRPISYRAEIIAPLIQSLSAGECCSLVGINGIGKTNMLQHLRRPDVVAHYAAGRGEPLAFCSLDANLLAEQNGWGFWEGLAEALQAGLREVLPTVALTRIGEEHAAILAAPGDYPIAWRRCAAALDVALAHVRLVIVFDEFDLLLPQLPAVTLRNLRGLRDRYKYRLMYLTLSRERLSTLCPDLRWDTAEPFLELLALCELGLHPLGTEDARREVARFAERHQRTITPPDYERIVELSGGHPGILRGLTHAALGGAGLSLEPRELISRFPALRDECLKLWNDLSGDERDVLWQAHGGGKINQGGGEDLLLKGLLGRDKKGQLVIFSPLLAALVALEIARTASVRPADTQPIPITIDYVSQQVRYYGQEIGDSLSPLNFRLLAYLYDHYGAICHEVDVSCAIYPDEQPDDSSERVSVLVRRLARKLREIAPNQPVLLQTIRGRGYRLGLPPG